MAVDNDAVTTDGRSHKAVSNACPSVLIDPHPRCQLTLVVTPLENQSWIQLQLRLMKSPGFMKTTQHINMVRTRT